MASKATAKEITIKQYITPKELAVFADLTVRRIQQLTQDGIIKTDIPAPGGRGRLYDSVASVKKLLQYYRKRAEQKNLPNDAMEAEKLRKLAANAELEEIKLAVAKAELHHTKDIEVVFGAMVTRLRVGLLALPQGVAPVLVEQSDINQIVEILTERIHRCLTEMINFDMEMFTSLRGSYVDDGGGEPDEETKG